MTAEQALKECAAIQEFLDNGRIGREHDWENLPLANRVVQLGPDVATVERRRIAGMIIPDDKIRLVAGGTIDPTPAANVTDWPDR